jgi:hypothetical protein
MMTTTEEPTRPTKNAISKRCIPKSASVIRGL